MTTKSLLITGGSLIAAVTVGLVAKSILATPAANQTTINNVITLGAAAEKVKGDSLAWPTGAAKKSFDSLEDANAAARVAAAARINLSVPTVIPGQTNPGGMSSGNLSFSNETGKKHFGLTFNANNGSVVQLFLQNCTNDTITLCKFINCTGYSIRAVNCKNLVVINNFFTMTNFGIRFEQCSGVKFNGNQWLNGNGPATKYQNNFCHFMQAYQCSGHQEYNDNRAENIVGQAIRMHDIFSIDNCSGVKGDSIQVKRNWFRGGQQTPYPGQFDLGGGIMAPDEAGSYYSITDNILVSTGCDAWQAVGTGSAVRFANNIIYNPLVYPSAHDGFSIQGNKTAFAVSGNRVYFKNHGGTVGGNLPGGETVYWLGSSSANPASMGITMSKNIYDTSLTANILPATIITYK